MSEAADKGKEQAEKAVLALIEAGNESPTVGDAMGKAIHDSDYSEGLNESDLDEWLEGFHEGYEKALPGRLPGVLA